VGHDLPVEFRYSRIERAYLSTDRRRYFVPCPHCGNYDWIRWPNVKWDEGRPETAALLCESCGSLIEERRKTWMLERGQWRATAEGAPHVAGYHLSRLYSPLGWSSWANVAREFLASKDDPAMLKTRVNAYLGETWQERGEAPEWQKVTDLRAPYRSGEIPDGVIIITAGVDVQKDRIYYAVRGRGAVSESWLIEHGEIYGDTDQPDVWNQLSLVLDGGFGDFNITKMFIDTGYRADAIYEFCRRHPGRAIPVKGTRPAGEAAQVCHYRHHSAWQNHQERPPAMARGYGLLQVLGARQAQLGCDTARGVAPARGRHRRLLPPARERVRRCLAQRQADVERAWRKPLP
jgi:phage terminase large subunit GpA-like protein